jgi:hypothetical protein
MKIERERAIRERLEIFFEPQRFAYWKNGEMFIYGVKVIWR